MGFTKCLLVWSTGRKNKEGFACLSSQQVFSSYFGGVSGSFLTLRCIFIPLQEADSWVIIEGLKIGQSNVQRPDKHEGFMLKKRKWPLKGWHKVRPTGEARRALAAGEHFETEQLLEYQTVCLLEMCCCMKEVPIFMHLASPSVGLFRNNCFSKYLWYQWKVVPVVAIFKLRTHRYNVLQPIMR